MGRWFVQMLDLDTGNTFEDTADVFMTGTGLLNEWKWPSIPGLHSFKGRLLHSACWDEEFDSEVSCRLLRQSRLLWLLLTSDTRTKP